MTNENRHHQEQRLRYGQDLQDLMERHDRLDSILILEANHAPTLDDMAMFPEHTEAKADSDA
jgi:hypothetical protein